MEGKNIVGLEMIDYLENQNKISSYTDELKNLWRRITSRSLMNYSQ